MSLATDAFSGLYPDEVPTHEFKIKYSAKFNLYNANVYYNNQKMEFRLSKNWKEIGRDIKIGLLQTLMLKVFDDKIKTMNIDLYNIFLKKVHIAIPKDNVDPILESSFNRINEKYFDGIIEMPNLIFGKDSKRKVGSYEYGSDTITISNILRNQNELIDYVMFHEILHKKFKYNVKNGRSYHHTKEFRLAEKKFENHLEMEKKLGNLLRTKKKWFEIL